MQFLPGALNRPPTDATPGSVFARRRHASRCVRPSRARGLAPPLRVVEFWSWHHGPFGINQRKWALRRGLAGSPAKTPRRASGILPVMMIGVGLDARLGLPFDQLRAAAQEAARFGFESLWTPAGGVPDAFHVCAAWSQDTSLRTGISVVPAARMWTPLGLAVQAATLAQLSAGRFVLGLGTGGYGPDFWESVGLPNRPIAVMREYVTEVRGLLVGQQVTARTVTGPAGTGQGGPGWPRSSA